MNQAECELLGSHIWDYIAPEQQSITRDAITRKIGGELPPGVVTRKYRRGDGSFMWVEIHERLMKNSAGETVGIRSALLDITERRNYDVEILRHHGWMKRVLQSIGSALIAADALGTIEFMNPAAEALTGWARPDARGLALEEVCALRHESGQRADLMCCLVSEPVVSNRSRKFEIVDHAGIAQGVQWNIAPVFQRRRRHRPRGGDRKALKSLVPRVFLAAALKPNDTGKHTSTGDITCMRSWQGMALPHNCGARPCPA